MTQRFPTARKTNRILEALLGGEHLSVALALQKYGVYALSQEVGRLKRLGWEVNSKIVHSETAHYCEYWLILDPIPECGWC